MFINLIINIMCSARSLLDTTRATIFSYEYVQYKYSLINILILSKYSTLARFSRPIYSSDKGRIEALAHDA